MPNVPISEIVLSCFKTKIRHKTKPRNDVMPAAKLAIFLPLKLENHAKISNPSP